MFVLRIIIDTDLQAIIVPDSYYIQVDRLNEIIVEAGGNPLEYIPYIQQCFLKAFSTKIIRKCELPALKAGQRPKGNCPEET